MLEIFLSSSSWHRLTLWIACPLTDTTAPPPAPIGNLPYCILTHLRPPSEAWDYPFELSYIPPQQIGHHLPPLIHCGTWLEQQILPRDKALWSRENNSAWVFSRLRHHGGNGCRCKNFPPLKNVLIFIACSLAWLEKPRVLLLQILQSEFCS